MIKLTPLVHLSNRVGCSPAGGPISHIEWRQFEIVRTSFSIFATHLAVGIEGSGGFSWMWVIVHALPPCNVRIDFNMSFTISPRLVLGHIE